MTILTIKAIRENPWNVIMSSFPDNPDPILLEAAVLAADYCRNSEFLIVKAVRLDLYRPPGLGAPATYTDEQWHEVEQLSELAYDVHRDLLIAYFHMFGHLPV